jgi:diguanylate cyclase (GGDEF)-like protein
LGGALAVNVELQNYAKDGSEYGIDLEIQPMHAINGELAGFMAIQLAYFDPLTKLANSRLLMDCLRQALVSSARSKKHGALLFIAVDGVEQRNNSQGHDMGDMLQQQVALRLSNCVRGCDTLARLESEEFVLLLEDLSENLQQATAQAEIIGNKILAEISKPYQLVSHQHSSSADIGVTMFQGGKHKIDELMGQADIALHQAGQSKEKHSGHNNIVFFRSGMRLD